MTFDLKQVNDFAHKLGKQFRASTSLIPIYMTWEDSKAGVLLYAKRYSMSNKNPDALGCYAYALYYASAFFLNSEPNHEQQKFLDDQVIQLKKAYKEVSPEGDLEMPLSFFEDLVQIKAYLNKFYDDAYHIAAEHLGSGHKTKIYRTWEACSQLIKEKADNYSKSDNDSYALGHYALALKITVNYLLYENQKITLTEEQKEFLDAQMGQLKEFNKGISAEVELFEASEVEPNEVGGIEDSEQFKTLKEYYLNTIRRDTRDHFFLCYDLKVNKASTLVDFLGDLLQFKSQDEVKDYLINFYRSKNSAADSAYNILNRGQNITSRFFGLKTTTIELIDDLARSLKIDLKAIESEESNEQDLNFDF
jgi:hypothetical protein